MSKENKYWICGFLTGMMWGALIVKYGGLCGL